jgi:hypothetical protein
MKKLAFLLALSFSGYNLKAQVGIGTLTPDANAALDINGKIKISGGGQSTRQGMVLTSDVNGLASWEGAVAFAAQGNANENINLSGGLLTKVLFSSENYDLGNNFSASVFTVPTHGIYQLNAKVSWIAPIGYFRVFGTLMLIRNGVETTLAQHKIYVETQMVASNEFNLDYELQPGDQLYVRIIHESNDPKSIYSENTSCRFSGRLVVKL